MEKRSFHDLKHCKDFRSKKQVIKDKIVTTFRKYRDNSYEGYLAGRNEERDLAARNKAREMDYQLEWASANMKLGPTRPAIQFEKKEKKVFLIFIFYWDL